MSGETTGIATGCIAVSVLLMCACIGPVRAAEVVNVMFDNSRNAAARDMFNHGVTLPHSFAEHAVDKQPVTSGKALPHGNCMPICCSNQVSTRSLLPSISGCLKIAQSNECPGRVLLGNQTKQGAE